MSELNIYTDGACRGNGSTNSKGSWGVVAFEGNNTQPIDSFGGYEPQTTNNKMELTAILQALQYIYHNRFDDKYEQITIFSDSEYSIKSITLWMEGWVKKNWKNVKNTDILQPIYQLKQKLPNIKYQHVRGHTGNHGNELVDQLCNTILDKH